MTNQSKLLLIDYTDPLPEENLSIDLRLLKNLEEKSGAPTLRFWESNSYFVVLGSSNKAEIECNLDTCKTDKIPILKRCSGGGTVLQGPGCLNYALILDINSHNELKQIKSSNDYIMHKNKNALSSRLPKLEVKGYTDLSLNKIKVSGNAQRRLKNSILFHGTFLYNFELTLIEKYLAHPSREPDYRQNRSHKDFIQNIKLNANEIKTAMINEWNAEYKTQ